ncbi:methyltransferase domain-containing protein [Candidatus Latescibacterota bacterium]
MSYINIGCGQTPTDGWNNYDNSLSLLAARMPVLVSVFRHLGLLSNQQLDFILFARNNSILYANAFKHIPEAGNSVDVVYSSHMLEHLNSEQAKQFLKEARRILKPGGGNPFSCP